MSTPTLHKDLKRRNTKEDEALAKKCKGRYRSYFLTYNNWTEEGLKKILAQNYIECYRIQEEKGKEGTIHLQGFIKFDRPVPWKSVVAVVPQVHWEVCRNKYAARNYCRKSDTATGKFWEHNLEALDGIKVKDPLKGKTKYSWQRALDAVLKQDPDDRSIIWIWDECGCTGKTTFMKSYAIKRNDVLISGGQAKDALYACAIMVLEKKKQPGIVFFNLSKSKYFLFDYSAMEQLKDGIFFSTKYKSNQVIMNSPWVVVFANKAPDKKEMSIDRWNIFKVAKVDNDYEIVEAT